MSTGEEISGKLPADHPISSEPLSLRDLPQLFLFFARYLATLQAPLSRVDFEILDKN